MLNLGLCYLNERTNEKAFELFKNQPIKTIQVESGYCYDYGIGTGINKQMAFELYKKTGPVAQYKFGLMYENGNGMVQHMIYYTK